MIKLLLKSIFIVLLIGLSSCVSTKNTSENNTVNNLEIKDLSGKWNIENTNDYIIFEDTTKKMVLKTSCGIITGDYIKTNQVLFFNQLNDYSAECLVPQILKNNLKETAYFKVNSLKKITFYDDNHKEKLTLLNQK